MGGRKRGREGEREGGRACIQKGRQASRDGGGEEEKETGTGSKEKDEQVEKTCICM